MSTAAEQRLIVTFTVDADREAGLNSWYNLEHVAPRIGLPEGDGFRNCARYVVTSGASRFLNMYDLDKGALESVAYGNVRDHEAGMDDVAYYTGHFKDEHPEDFRRLVVNHDHVLVDNHRAEPADAVVLDIVRGTGFDDLAGWGVNGLKGQLQNDGAVSRSTVWSIDGDPGFVLATELSLATRLDWRPYYGGVLSWLPEGTFGEVVAETILGHQIARFERPDSP